MAFTKLMQCSITLKKTGIVKVSGIFAQGFSTIPAFWSYYLVIDGQTVFDAGNRNYPGDVVPIYGLKSCNPGLRTAEFWYGSNGQSYFQYGAMDMAGFNNTSG